MTEKILPGKPYPLGATRDRDGTNFAIYSENAEKIELCLFDEPVSKNEREHVSLREVTGHVWHCYLPGIEPVLFDYYPRSGALFLRQNRGGMKNHEDHYKKEITP